MDLVLYTLKLRLAQFLSPQRDWKGFVFFLLLLAISWFYAHGIASFLDNMEFYDHSPEAYNLLKPSLAIFIGGITLLRAFFPSYKRLSSWIQAFQPVSRSKRYLVKLLTDFSSSYFICLCLAILYLAVKAVNFTGLEGMVLLLVLFGTHVLRRILQVLLENKHRFDVLTLVVLLGFLLSAIGLQIYAPFYRMDDWIILSATVSLLLGAGYYLEEHTKAEQRNNAGFGFSIRNPIPAIFLRTKAVRTSLMFGFLFKVFLIVTLIKTGEKGFNTFVLILFISPAILFTYVYNNLWGHFRNTWKLVDGSSGNGFLMLKYYLKLLSLPLALDFLILVVYLFFQENTVSYLLIYICSLLVLVANGFFWSMQSPFVVNKMVMGMKSNTSFIGTLISIVMVGSFALVVNTFWLWVMMGVYLLLSGAVLNHLVKDYPSYRNRLFRKLYKA